jgi:hypothetical protein
LEGPADQINLGFVLGNKIAFGSVNANREYFETGVKNLSTAELQIPWLVEETSHASGQGTRELRRDDAYSHRDKRVN